MHRTRAILIVLFLILTAALCANPSYAQTVTFSYSFSCDTNQDPHCLKSDLRVATGPGGIAGDTVTIATVNSDVPGYTQPVPINKGLLNFTSSPATRVMCDPPPSGCYAIYDDPGGSAAISGSVFGLPDGTPLLNAWFQGGAQSQGGLFHTNFSGTISISFINPVLLNNLGLAGASNCGTGGLRDVVYYDYQSGIASQTVSVTFTPGSCYKALHSFTGGIDGGAPSGGPTIDGAGNLYGTTFSGGAGYGTVYKLTQKGSGWIFNPLYSLRGGKDGTYPSSAVIIGLDGTLYGTTGGGGGGRCMSGYPGCGTVFTLRPRAAACQTAVCSWSEYVIHSFTGGSDGAYSFGNVVEGQSGNLFGTTVYGGMYGDCDNYDGFGCGIAYMLTPALGGWKETVLWNFGQGNDGQMPYAGMIFDKAGNLYGTTARGGQYGQGTVFQLTPSGSGWTENILYSFQGESDGSSPYAGLIVDASGNFYGATPVGGQGGGGTVFELTPSNGNWTFSVLYSFPGVQGTYTGPYGSLVMDKAGSLYGTTSGNFGQYGDYGTVFKLTPSADGWTYKLMYAFTGGPDGQSPYSALVLDSNGNLYGTAANNGAYGYGVVFEITPY